MKQLLHNLIKRIAPFVSIVALLSMSFPMHATGAGITISDLSVDIEGTDVYVGWRTSQPTTGCVEFGTSRNYDLQLCSIAGFRTSHDLLASNLLPETVYHFRIVSRGEGGVEAVSFDGTFETGERADTTTPEVKNLNIEFVGATTAYLTWETNEKANGTLEYGNDSSDLRGRVGTRSALEHQAQLSRLTPGATYFYRIKVEDEDKNVAYSSIQSFRTALNTRLEESPLEISQVRPIAPGDTQVGETEVTVTWRNSRPANGRVIYGTNPERLRDSVRIDVRKVMQSVEITSLRPGTTYYYRIEQHDFLRKKGVMPGEDSTYSFTTKGRAVVLGTSSQSSSGTAPSRVTQPAVLSSIGSSPKVLGTFTTIYTPATSLIKTMHSPRIYAVLNNQKHWIKNEAVFKSYGYSFANVKIISLMEMNKIQEVNLAKSPNSPTVYYLYHEQGVKIPIPSESVFNSYPDNDWKNVVKLSDVDLNSYSDARLVKTPESSTIYLLENNRRRAFTSVEVLERFGFNKAQVVIINNTHLQTFSEGERIE